MSQRSPYWSGKKGDQIIMLSNCLAAWLTIGPKLGFSGGQVAEFSQLLTEFLAVLNEVDQCQYAMRAATEWRNEVLFGPETNKTAPASPTITTPTAPTINGGFFEQLKRWRSQIMVSADYTEANGEALGLIGPIMPSRNLNVAQPDFRVVPATDYWVNFNGSLQGFDAVDVEYQRKGGTNWENFGYLTKTPGGLQITPTTAGTAEIGMIRCRFVKKNETVGNYSPSYSVTIS